jgi:hypothetical protein
MWRHGYSKFTPEELQINIHRLVRRAESKAILKAFCATRGYACHQLSDFLNVFLLPNGAGVLCGEID